MNRRHYNEATAKCHAIRTTTLRKSHKFCPVAVRQVLAERLHHGFQPRFILVVEALKLCAVEIEHSDRTSGDH